MAWGARASKIKFKKSTGRYEISTGNCTFNPNTLYSDSFGWWPITMKIKGKLVFNDYNYSGETSAHQSLISDLLKKLKVKVDVVVKTRSSLNSLESQGIAEVFREVLELRESVKSTRKKPHTIKWESRRLKDAEKNLSNIRKIFPLTRDIENRVKAELQAEKQAREESSREARELARQKRAENSKLIKEVRVFNPMVAFEE